MLPLSRRKALERLIHWYDTRMISKNGYFDWMIQDPGPLAKTNGGRNTIIGVVPHSAEGFWPHLQTLLHSPARRASWAFSNLKDGRCFQHYSVYAQTWTSGSAFPNNNFVAWENEGVAGEPLTEKQTDNIVRIIKELSALGKWQPRRPTGPNDKSASMYEHRECVRFGSEPTACPSGRIPWGEIILKLNTEEDDMAAIQLVWNPDFQRLYVLGQKEPTWITDPAVAADLQKAYGPPKVALSWQSLRALGAF